jgi:type III pantothenate kinase
MPENILLLDIGNTRIKWASLNGRTFLAGGELLHAAQLDSKNLTQISTDILPDRIVAACVAGNMTENKLQEWAQRQFQREIEYVTSVQQGYGVINAYSDPAQLGSDRWVAMIAAHHEWQGNLCVIDAGTALTLDLVQSNGLHLGGYIFPGLDMMQRCLVEGTEIPMSSDPVIFTENTRLGDSTIGCISNGALQGACGLVERTVLHFEKQRQEPVKCIVAGGDGQLLADNLTIPCIIEPDLVLRGLGYIARSRAAIK